jgi:transcription elongation factor GreB
VTIEDTAGSLRRHRIVGPDEFDREPGYLSMDAPLGRALLGKRIGDELEVQLPGGVLTARITAIDYENEGDAHLQPR